MKPLQRALAALTTLLLVSTLWACNKDTTPAESAQTRSATYRPIAARRASPARAQASAGDVLQSLLNAAVSADEHAGGRAGVAMDDNDAVQSGWMSLGWIFIGAALTGLLTTSK